MKTITTNNRTLLFVEVPEGADISDMQMIADDEFAYSIPNPDPDYNDYITKYVHLHSGMYRYIATTDTITEQQADMLVKNNGMGCYDNHKGKPDEIYTCTTALESFATFLQHHSITGRHAIIEGIMNKTPLQKSIAEIEAMIAEQRYSIAIAAMFDCIRILTANLEYEREVIMKAFEFSANLKTDLSASDYYTKTYEHERKD